MRRPRLVPPGLCAAVVASGRRRRRAEACGSAATADAAYYFILARHLEGLDKIDEAIAALQQALSAGAGVGRGARGARRAVRAAGPAHRRAQHGGRGAEARSEQPRSQSDPGDDFRRRWRTRRRRCAPVTIPRSIRRAPSPRSRRRAAIGSDLNLLLTLGRLQLRAGQHDKASAPHCGASSKSSRSSPKGRCCCRPRRRVRARSLTRPRRSKERSRPIRHRSARWCG